MGMRRGEAIGLRWSDVDLENARPSVRRALIPIKGAVVVSEPKTVKRRRVIALDPSTIEVLKAPALREAQPEGLPVPRIISERKTTPSASASAE